MTTATKSRKPVKKPNGEHSPVPRFSVTPRIQAFEAALGHNLHLVRDNFHLWAIRKSDKAQIWLCSSTSYDGLWRAAVQLFRLDDFDPAVMPYSTGESETQVAMYDPRTKQSYKIDKKDLRRRRNEYAE